MAASLESGVLFFFNNGIYIQQMLNRRSGFHAAEELHRKLPKAIEQEHQQHSSNRRES